MHRRESWCFFSLGTARVAPVVANPYPGAIWPPPRWVLLRLLGRWGPRTIQHAVTGNCYGSVGTCLPQNPKDWHIDRKTAVRLKSNRINCLLENTEIA